MNPLSPDILASMFLGTLLGSAVGDAIGLPREGLSPARALKIFGKSPLHHRFFLNQGMTSDDTEHACMVAQALLVSCLDSDRFTRSLAWKLRFWLLGLPAGVGFATLRSILKLWIGFPPSKSGVWSAGNGPAMRAPILGAFASSTPDPKQFLRQFVAASTQITHSDPAAFHGALAVALATLHGIQLGPTPPAFPGFLDFIRPDLENTPLFQIISNMRPFLLENQPLNEYLNSLGLQKGVTGYINHTVPAVLYCWLRNPADFRGAIEEIILAGGDSDTTAAVLGGLLGASAGVQSIPQGWIDDLLEWPRNVRWMTRLADALASKAQSPNAPVQPIPLNIPALLARNLFFLLIVLLHGFRRLLPPY